MDFYEILNMVLPIVYVVAGAVLVWLVIELVVTIRWMRKTVDDLQKQIEPTLAHVESITSALEPAVAKADPLMERVSLTVDAANLELMRVDQILENVGEITESVSGAVDAVDAAANAPMELVNNVTAKVRGAFKPRRASDDSVALGQVKGGAESGAVKNLVDASVQAAGAAVAEQRAQMQKRKSEREQHAQEKREVAMASAEVASNMGDAVVAAADDDVSRMEGKPSEKNAGKYFTYAAENSPESDHASEGLHAKGRATVAAEASDVSGR